MNCAKPGFRKLVSLLLSGCVEELVLTHKDRLLRFGSEIVFMICRAFHVRVTILYEEAGMEPTQRFCQDQS